MAEIAGGPAISICRAFFPSPLVGEGGSLTRSGSETDEGYVPADTECAVRTPHPALRATFSHKGRREKKNYALRASAPSIMLTAFGTPYTATNEPKRGPFSWPSSTW